MRKAGVRAGIGAEREGTVTVQMAALLYSVSKQLCFTGLPASGHPHSLHFIRAVPVVSSRDCYR